MNKHLPLLILALLGGLLAVKAQHDGEGDGAPALWRLTLDWQGYDGDFQPVSPFPLRAGESVDTDGDTDGYLGGLTLTFECPTNRVIHGVDASILAGEFDGEPSYSGTFAGTTSIETELYILKLRGRHNLLSLANDNFHPFVFLGVAYRNSETEERGIVAYTPVDLDLRMHRRTDAETKLFTPGIGATLDLHRGRATLGLRGEASLQLGKHDVDSTEGGSADDGNVFGYNLLAALYGVLPLTESWSLYGQGGVSYQDWMEEYDELQPGATLFVSLGLQYEF